MPECLAPPYLDNKMVALPLNRCSSSIRSASAGAVTPPCPLGSQLVFRWHLLSNLPSHGLYSSRALKCRVCSVRLRARPAVGQVHPGWSSRLTVEGHQECSKVTAIPPQKVDNPTQNVTQITWGGKLDVSLKHWVCRIFIKCTFSSLG